MKCPKCGTENLDTNNFCTSCSSNLKEKQSNNSSGMQACSNQNSKK